MDYYRRISYKQPFKGWWLTSTATIECDLIGIKNIILLGYHRKSTKLGISPKPDITIITEYDTVESFPFKPDDMSKIYAGIVVASYDNDIFHKSYKRAVKMSKKTTLYNEINIRSEDEIDKYIVKPFGKSFTSIDYCYDLNSIELLKKCYIFDIRKGHNFDSKIFIAVGRNTEKRVPILVFKKSINNFYAVANLMDDGLNLLTSFNILIRHPPIPRIININENDFFDQYSLNLIRYEKSGFIKINSLGSSSIDEILQRIM